MQLLISSDSLLRSINRFSSFMTFLLQELQIVLQSQIFIISYVIVYIRIYICNFENTYNFFERKIEILSKEKDNRHQVTVYIFLCENTSLIYRFSIIYLTIFNVSCRTIKDLIQLFSLSLWGLFLSGSLVSVHLLLYPCSYRFPVLWLIAFEWPEIRGKYWRLHGRYTRSAQRRLVGCGFYDSRTQSRVKLMAVDHPGLWIKVA